MSGIGIITNPHSKLNKRNPERTKLLGYILGQQGQLEVTNTLADLSRVAREFCQRGIDILAINGGDGSICLTLTAFIKEYELSGTKLPRVALLRGGTINVLANNLGIRGAPEHILFRLVGAHAAGQPLQTRTLSSIKVEGNYGFLFGNGAGASFLKEYYKRKSNPVGAFIFCLRVWVSRFVGKRLYDRVIRDLHQTLLPDAQPPITHSSCAVFCSTVARMPLGYPLFPHVKNKLGQFQCVSFSFAARDAVWQLPVVLLKMQEGSTTGKLSLSCRSMKISAEAPFDYTLDGELYTSRASHLTVEMGPDIEFVTL